MSRKSLQTPDGRHVQFGEVDTLTMPDGFTAPDNGAFCSNYSGQEMENVGGGFGAAYNEWENYPEGSETD